MKKILMFLSCVFALNINVAFGEGDCPSGHISFKGTQGPNDNEFVYSTVKAQHSAVDGFKTSKSFDLSGGKVFECDNEQGCMNGRLIFLDDNSGYVFKGDVIKHKIMSCSVGFQDKWIAQDWTECPDSKINETYKIKFINTTSADCHKIGAYNYCCFTGDHKACLEAQKRGEPANWTQSGTCNCGDRHVWNSKTGHCDAKDNGGGNTAPKECPNQDEKRACLASGDEADWKEASCKCLCRDPNEIWTGKACVRKTQDNHNCGPDAEWKNGACVCKDPNKKWENGHCVEKAAKSCRETRTTNIGKACCDVTYAKYDVAKDKCTCRAGEKFELYNTNHGRCVKVDNGGGNGGGNVEPPVVVPPVVPPVVEPPYTCPMDAFANWRTLYKDCPDVIEALDELDLYCASSEPKKDGYMTRYTKLQELRKMCEDDKASKLRITKSTATINSAAQQLNDIMAGLKISVWKNREGEFNTARLASDSIAGVVLGTAGGLITSHLVKKGQVKAGFEDIQCTIGGQKVADWGDEFTVGIR